MSMQSRALCVRVGLGAALALAGALAAPLAASAQPAPPKGNHYQCYPAKQEEPAKGVKVLLADQFGKQTVVTGAVTRLCNPVAKQIPGAEPFPIIDKTMHLVCVRIASQQPGKAVKVRNQFGVFTLTVGQAQELCLPSSKILVGPAAGK